MAASLEAGSVSGRCLVLLVGKGARYLDRRSRAHCLLLHGAGGDDSVRALVRSSWVDGGEEELESRRSGSSVAVALSRAIRASAVHGCALFLFPF